MKKLLKIPVLLLLFAAGSLLSGCMASAGVGYSDVGPYYGAGPYYGRAYPYYGQAYGYRPYARPYYRNRTTVVVAPQPHRAPRGVVRGHATRPNTTFHNAHRSSHHNNSHHNNSVRGGSHGSVRGGGSRGRVR